MSDSKTTARQVCLDLRPRVLDGQLSSEDALMQPVLALASSTPPRAAIARIERDNAIARPPNGALLVRSLPNADLPETLRRFGQRAIGALEAVTV